MKEKAYTQQEIRKLKKLISEYQKKGYEVILYPSTEALPISLVSFSPGLLIKKDLNNIIVEVKSRESIKESGYLVDLAQEINNLKNWEFELVITNSKNKKDKIENNLINYSKKDVQQKLERLKKSSIDENLEIDSSEAWNLFLLASRFKLKKENQRIKPQFSSFGIIKQLYIYGIISRKEYFWLKKISEEAEFKLQNFKKNDLNKLINISKDFINLS